MIAAGSSTDLFKEGNLNQSELFVDSEKVVFNEENENII